MADIITTLHPDNDDETNLYPNIKKENIPDESIDRSKLDDDINALLDNISGLHPAGTDISTNILAYTENKGIYIGTDTGHWYYWNGTQYVDGGVYQATEVPNGSVTNVKLQDISCLKRFGILSSDVPLNDSSFLTKNGTFVINDASTRYSNNELPTTKNGILMNLVGASYWVQYYITYDGYEYTRANYALTWKNAIPSNTIVANQIVNNNVLKKGSTVASATSLNDNSIINTSCMFPISDAVTRYSNNELPTNKNGLLINYTGDGWWTQFYITHDGEIYTRGRFNQTWKDFNKINGSNIINGTITIDKFAFSFKPYDLDMAKGLVRAEKRNPFEFKTFNTPKIIFMVDDMYNDFDKIASIFEEYNFPLSVACIPSRLSVVCDGLTEDTGSYTVGMTNKEVCDVIVSLGGEILAHNGSNIVTAENQYNYNFMYDYFVTTKETLRSNGFTINGLIKAGGTGSINGTHEIEKWLIGNYDYSDMGSAINYNKQRFGMEYYTLADLISHIDYAINNNGWIVVYTHRLSTIGETYLRSVLDYVDSHNITPTTYKELFDNFSSSKFLNSIE